jgi:hypothetical protein
MVDKLKHLITLMRTMRKFPAFFLGVVVSGLIFLYLYCSEVETVEYTSAHGNTVVHGLQDVCTHDARSLIFFTEASRKRRVGVMEIERADYCGQEKFSVKGTFKDNEIGKNQAVCTGIFYATVGNDNAYFLFDIRYNKTEGCPDNDRVSGVTLYKKISLLQSYIFKIKNIF